jgi:hypothetical protein
MRDRQRPTSDQHTREVAPRTDDTTRAMKSLPLLALGLYAAAVLTIGLRADWRLRHEDNGAMHTTLALSHLRLGLERTRWHDVFVNPGTGETTPYGHHPPATALLLAGAFALTGSDAPAVARLTVILFQLGSVLLFVAFLTEFVPGPSALLGGFVMTTLPMSGYFGRMVNYEPLCLLAVLVQLDGYARFARTGRRRYLWELAAGVIAGGLIDWPSFFFTGTLAAVEGVALLRRQSTTPAPLVVLVASALSILAFDLWHLWWAAGGSLEALRRVTSVDDSPWIGTFSIRQFVLGQLDTFRRYFTEVGFIAALTVGVALALQGSRLSQHVFEGVPDGASRKDSSEARVEVRVLRRVLTAAGLAALGYILAAPNWAAAHQYWQFYFLPFVVTSMVLMWRLLVRTLAERPMSRLRILQIVCILDVLVASGYWLHFRHTRVEAYAVETTAWFRANFLIPNSFNGGNPVDPRRDPPRGTSEPR